MTTLSAKRAHHAVRTATWQLVQTRAQAAGTGTAAGVVVTGLS